MDEYIYIYIKFKDKLPGLKKFFQLYIIFFP